MAKGNPFMGTARGKLADMVLYRRGGEQISRVRIRRIANPRTEAQLVNRIVVSTFSKRYAILKPICDHAFQGFSTPAKNMAEFMKQNVSMVNAEIAEKKDSIRYWETTMYNFNGRNDYDALVGETIVSKGTLPTIMAYRGGTEDNAGIVFSDMTGLGANPTYAQIANALGLQLGDQVTLLITTGNLETGTMRGLVVARFILQPSEGGGTTAFISNGVINSPNLKNEMAGITVSYDTENGLSFTFTDIPKDEAVAYATIASRYSAGQWERSLAYLWSFDDFEDKTMRLAIDSWDESVSSSLYLNQG